MRVYNIKMILLDPSQSMAMYVDVSMYSQYHAKIYFTL
jgi:hypothetical protein